MQCLRRDQFNVTHGGVILRNHRNQDKDPVVLRVALLRGTGEGMKMPMALRSPNQNTGKGTADRESSQHDSSSSEDDSEDDAPEAEQPSPPPQQPSQQYAGSSSMNADQWGWVQSEITSLRTEQTRQGEELFRQGAVVDDVQEMMRRLMLQFPQAPPPPPPYQ